MDINTLCIARDWYGVENKTVLGMTYMQALSSYSTSFKTFEYNYWRYDQ